MKEFRMTRPDLYGSGPARTDLSARQGHYIQAVDEQDAHRQMRKAYPDDSHFDLELWKEL